MNKNGEPRAEKIITQGKESLVETDGAKSVAAEKGIGLAAGQRGARHEKAIPEKFMRVFQSTRPG